MKKPQILREKIIRDVFKCPVCFKQFSREFVAEAHIENCLHNLAMHELKEDADQAYGDLLRNGNVPLGGMETFCETYIAKQMAEMGIEEWE